MSKKKTRRRKNRSVLMESLVVLVIIAIALWLLSAVNVYVEGGDSSLKVNVGEEYENKIHAHWLGIDITKYGKFSGEVDTNKPGTYYVSYLAPFSLDPITIFVTVVDNVSPVITLKGDAVVYVDNLSLYEEAGYVATDNYDGDLTGSVQTGRINVSKKEYMIDYFVKDSSGNFTVVTRTVKEKNGVVYLTFDDGPSVDITPQILDTLKEYDVKATFFVVGFSGKEKENLIKRMYDEGHVIAYHGYSHDYGTIYKSFETVMDNFIKIENEVLSITGGESTKIIRFPGGSSNTISKKYCNGVMTESVIKMTEAGYVYFDWNVDSMDAGGAKNSDEVYQNVVMHLSSGNNVVLMHDFSGNQKTVNALSRIIEFCINNNYELKVLTDNTMPVHHKVAN